VNKHVIFDKCIQHVQTKVVQGHNETEELQTKVVVQLEARQSLLMTLDNTRHQIGLAQLELGDLESRLATLRASNAQLAKDVQAEDKRMVELDVQRDQIQLSHQQKMKIVSEKVQTLKDIQSFLPAPSTVRPIPKSAKKESSASSLVSPGSSPSGGGGAALAVAVAATTSSGGGGSSSGNGGGGGVRTSSSSQDINGRGGGHSRQNSQTSQDSIEDGGKRMRELRAQKKILVKAVKKLMSELADVRRECEDYQKQAASLKSKLEARSEESSCADRR